MHLMTYCQKCRAKLIPVIHGRVDPEYLDLMSQGKIIVSLQNEKKYNSFCPLCEESYESITEMPGEVDTSSTDTI